MTIKTEELSGMAYCWCSLTSGKNLMSCWDAFPEISCTLEEGNCYGLISDFACGSWGFARTLAGYGKLMSGRIIISNQEITGKELRLI